MKKIYIPQSISSEAIDFLKEKGYEIISGTGVSIEEMKKDIKDCDAMILRTAQCPEEVIEAGKKLKIIARHGVGYDNVDVNAATEAGVIVTNTPLALSESVAEFTIGALLMAAKNIRNSSNSVYEGNYTYKHNHKGLDVFGKTLGLVGFGRIGQTVAKKANKGLDLNILVYKHGLREEDVPHYVTLCDWDILFKESDFITLHCPGGERNRGLIGKREFSMMKETAILINTARGELIDEIALKESLDKGGIRGAFLDVQSTEPPEKDYPLLKEDKVILTPHMASNTEECMMRMALQAADQVDKVLSGKEPDWPVN